MFQVINHTLIKVFILVGCTWIALGCTPQETLPLETTTHSFANSSATLTMPAGPVPVEQAMVIELSLPPLVKPGLSQVEGVSMYMGSVPLLWKENDTGDWQTTLYLGACTEPRMLWRLTIPLIRPAETGAESLSLTFESVAN
ncbi:hypothetical protein J6J08_03940 [Pseudidiomarina sp. 1APR75-33.1]|uniref:hypothetical protein n=1 Tax=Pseudidiomarina terrestris TaxID=2820060 RepID=UPI0026560E62|nr:hypothetical protein [Pseudidiomarina sp. 1APR75-33.1]MDN7126528.1 hypothetical protein [Pseudidiomarina sp. 1APR75-33.1]